MSNQQTNILNIFSLYLYLTGKSPQVLTLEKLKSGDIHSFGFKMTTWLSEHYQNSCWLYSSNSSNWLIFAALNYNIILNTLTKGVILQYIWLTILDFGLWMDGWTDKVADTKTNLWNTSIHAVLLQWFLFPPGPGRTRWGRPRRWGRWRFQNSESTSDAPTSDRPRPQSWQVEKR